jgi:hypothetical protein
VSLEREDNIIEGALSVVGKGIRNHPAQSEWKLKLTAANEVVVVEQSKLDKGYEKFLNTKSNCKV